MLGDARPITERRGDGPGVLAEAVFATTEPVVLRGIATDWPMVQAARRSMQDAVGYLHDHVRADAPPVVATTAGGPREFVWHDVNGFLVDANAGGMAHGIGSLLADHDHCRALGANGRKAVEEKFNWDNVAAYTEGVYHVVAR